MLGNTSHGTHRTSAVAQATADAALGVDSSDGKGQLAAVFGVDLERGTSRERGKLFHAFLVARGTVVDFGASLGDGAGVLCTAVKTTLTALGLRQKTAKRLGEALCGVCFRHRQTSKEETADFLG